jgi:hypothetical protein
VHAGIAKLTAPAGHRSQAGAMAQRCKEAVDQTVADAEQLQLQLRRNSTKTDVPTNNATSAGGESAKKKRKKKAAAQPAPSAVAAGAKAAASDQAAADAQALGVHLEKMRRLLEVSTSGMRNFGVTSRQSLHDHATAARTLIHTAGHLALAFSDEGRPSLDPGGLRLQLEAGPALAVAAWLTRLAEQNFQEVGGLLVATAEQQFAEVLLEPLPEVQFQQFGEEKVTVTLHSGGWLAEEDEASGDASSNLSSASSKAKVLLEAAGKAIVPYVDQAAPRAHPTPAFFLTAPPRDRPHFCASWCRRFMTKHTPALEQPATVGEAEEDQATREELQQSYYKQNLSMQSGRTAEKERYLAMRNKAKSEPEHNRTCNCGQVFDLAGCQARSTDPSACGCLHPRNDGPPRRLNGLFGLADRLRSFAYTMSGGWLLFKVAAEESWTELDEKLQAAQRPGLHRVRRRSGEASWPRADGQRSQYLEDRVGMRWGISGEPHVRFETCAPSHRSLRPARCVPPYLTRHI